jgi:hypothetical protein
LSRQTPFSMWPGGVKPSSSHRTSIESNVATRQLTVATVQGHPLPRSKRETEGYYQPVSSLETKMTSPTATPATTRLPIPLEMQDRDDMTHRPASTPSLARPTVQHHPLPRMTRDCHGFEKPMGFAMGLSGVWVRVQIFVPPQNPYPSHGYGG